MNIEDLTIGEARNDTCDRCHKETDDLILVDKCGFDFVCAACAGLLP